MSLSPRYDRSRAMSRGRSREPSRASARVITTVTGNSGGSLKVVKRPSKMLKKFDTLGATGKYEFSAASTHPEAGYIGHASMPRKLLLETVWKAILKRMWSKVGVLVEDLTTDLPYVQSIGDNLTLIIKQTAGAANQTLTYPISTTGLNINAQAAYLASQSITFRNQVMYIELQYIPASGSKLKFQRMNLKNAKLTLKSEAHLTIQNQTKQEVGGSSSTDVVNILPLRGRMYKGYGTGTQLNTDALNDFWADENKGIIAPINIANAYTETPEGYQFLNVKYEGPIKFEPGEVKQSHLYDTMTIGLNNLLRKLQDNPSGPGIYKVGKFAFVYFEKMIDSVTSDNTISMSFEHQINMRAIMWPGTLDVTNPAVYDD